MRIAALRMSSRSRKPRPPSGVANYGLFWFDSGCHCPRVISNNGQAVQLGLLNVFNGDANTLEEYNGTNPQVLRVYGTRTDASNYERIGFKWDNADGYFAVASENGGIGSQRGIGFWIGNNIRWAIDTASSLKPFSDNSYNVGLGHVADQDLLRRHIVRHHEFRRSDV